MLSPAAFNALLKIGRAARACDIHSGHYRDTQGAGHDSFTLSATTSCASSRRISKPGFCMWPGREGIQLAKDAAELISRLADGAMRDALPFWILRRRWRRGDAAT